MDKKRRANGEHDSYEQKRTEGEAKQQLSSLRRHLLKYFSSTLSRDLLAASGVSLALYLMSSDDRLYTPSIAEYASQPNIVHNIKRDRFSAALLLSSYSRLRWVS